MSTRQCHTGSCILWPLQTVAMPCAGSWALVQGTVPPSPAMAAGAQPVSVRIKLHWVHPIIHFVSILVISALRGTFDFI